MGRKTISGMLCAGGKQFMDWTAAYRLFEQQRFDSSALFAPARAEVMQRIDSTEPLVAMMDDTLLRKRGRKVTGTAWRRDPLGPPFCNNFVWAQRFVQVSAALPEDGAIGRACGIPIDLVHAPSAKKPKKTAPAEQWNNYLEEQKRLRVSAVGANRIAHLRQSMDTNGLWQNRKLVVSVDGGFTNKTVFRDLPHDTTAIGRIRKDARLYAPPEELQSIRRGRRSFYGAPLQTPEQIRQDDSIPWIPIRAYGARAFHEFHVKTVDSVRWLGTGNRTVRVVVIRPLRYRPSKKHRLLYRDPAYLLCTDPELPLDRLLQAYLWRWEIELNFRDEKTVLGMGEAQVRTEKAVQSVPTMIAASYAFLLLAAHNDNTKPQLLPAPKWRAQAPALRPTTVQMIGALRSQLWSRSLQTNLPHFVSTTPTDTKCSLFNNPLLSAALYAFR
jgi:hypothetical protein